MKPLHWTRIITNTTEEQKSIWGSIGDDYKDFASMVDVNTLEVHFSKPVKLVANALLFSFVNNFEIHYYIKAN